jgi:hypothetical protein
MIYITTITTITTHYFWTVTSVSLYLRIHYFHYFIITSILQNLFLPASVQVRLRVRPQVGPVPQWLATSSWQVWNACDWRSWRLLLCWLQTVMVQPLLSHLSQSIPSHARHWLRKRGEQQGPSSETFIAPTLLLGSSSGRQLSRQVQAHYSASSGSRLAAPPATAQRRHGPKTRSTVLIPNWYSCITDLFLHHCYISISIQS